MIFLDLNGIGYCKKCKQLVLHFNTRTQSRGLESKCTLNLEETIKLLRLLVNVFPAPIYCCIVSAFIASVITSPFRAVKSFVAMLANKFRSPVKKHTNKEIAKFNLLNKFFHNNRISGSK